MPGGGGGGGEGGTRVWFGYHVPHHPRERWQWEGQ